MKACTLVWEFNFASTGGECGSKASVWLFSGDGRQDLKRQMDGWVKVVGPVSTDLATQISSSLKKFLSQNGVEVFEESTSD